MTTANTLFVMTAVTLSLLFTSAVTSTSTGFLDKGNAMLLGDEMPLTLKYLGIVDGKAYFADVDQRMNWTAAGAYCQDSNLKLATAQSKNQVDFLIKTLAEFGYTGLRFWTAARETRRPSMLVWNGTEEQFDDSFWGYSSIVRSSGYAYCGVFDLHHNVTLHLQTYDCETTAHLLCET